MSTFGTMDEEIALPLKSEFSSSSSERNRFDHTELEIKSGDTSVFISPEMGGMVTRFRASVGNQTREILHFEESEFNSAGKKPKIGIPILMPFAGPDPLVRQHGWLREVPWVWEESTESSITLSLKRSGIQDKKLLSELDEKFGIGGDFEYSIRISVSKMKIRYDISIMNHWEKGMPVAPGLHPYFRIDSALQPEMKSNLQGFDLSNRNWTPDEETLVCTRPWYRESVWFTIPWLWIVFVNCDSRFDSFIVWSKRNGNWEKEDYVCIEPWVGWIRAVDDPARRMVVPAKWREQLSIEFELIPERFPDSNSNHIDTHINS